MKKILFILFATLLFTACKKENRIEKNLWRGGGEWKIETKENIGTHSLYEDQNYSEIENDIGTVQFNKDGSGAFNIDGANAYSEPFTYKNTETKLKIYDEAGNLTSYELEWKRNEFTMSFNISGTYETMDENNNPIIVNISQSKVFKCEKK